MSLTYENNSSGALTTVPSSWENDLHRQQKRGIELLIPLRTLLLSAGLGAVLLVASTAAAICGVHGCSRGVQASSTGLSVNQTRSMNSSSPCSASWRGASDPVSSSTQEQLAAPKPEIVPQSQETKGTVEPSLFLGKKRSGRGTTVADTIHGPAAWQVVHHGFLMVRSANSTSAKVIGMKARCIMVLGERYGDWLRLAHEPGFMLIHKEDGTSLLEKSQVGYKRVREGTCADKGLHVISDSASCKAAALAVGFPDVTAQTIQDADKPEGCYMLGNSLWLSINDANKGRGAQGGREPLCSTQTEPIPEPCRSLRTVQEREPTNATTETRLDGVAVKRGHALFCFSLIEPESYEIELLTVQMENSASIFRCDSSTVLSVGKELAVGSMWRTVAIPRPSDSALQAAAPSNELLATHGYVQRLEATLMHMKAWAMVMKKGTLWDYDWTAKVAADAVFLPGRLLKRLERVFFHRSPIVSGQKLHFVQDCRNEERAHGSIDVFSKAAMHIFDKGERRCKRELNWHAWSHSYFMTRCLQLLGISGPGPQISDKVFGAGPCHPSSCNDPSRISFYGFRDADKYVQCMESANAEDLEDLWDNVKA